MTVRQELERWVGAENKHLQSVVADMTSIILLRNCTPTYRGDFALRMYRAKLITLEETREFTDPRGLSTARYKNN